MYVVGSDDYGLGRVLDNGESQLTKGDLKIYNHVFEIGLERGIWAEQKKNGGSCKEILYLWVVWSWAG